jgi:Flp pilus assembly secretin CpaC
MGVFRRHVARAGVLVGIALLCACAVTPPPPQPHAGFEKRLIEWTAGHAVSEGMDRQVEPVEPSMRPPAETMLAPGEKLWIRSGKSRIIQFARPVRRVSVGNPDIAGIVVVGPRSVLINGKELPPREGQQQGPTVAQMRLATVSNTTFTPDPYFRETTLTVWEQGAAEPQVHSLFVAEFTTRAVMLDVTVAELNRTAMEQHGIDFRQIGTTFVSAFFLGGGAAPILGTTVPALTGQPLLPLNLSSTQPQYVFQLPRQDITAFIKLLQSEGLATVMAQPRLIAMSGQNAVFQVGGEIPIRIVSGFAADVQFKPFGTLVNFLPHLTDEGDIILTVTPEVSRPDFTNEVEGVPSFVTRRASTSAKLRNGETLVIGGLMENDRNETVRGVPYLMNIPGVGYIFRDTTYSDSITELMVIVTPHLIAPLPPGTELATPADRGPFTFDETKTQWSPAEVTRPRVPGALIKPNPPFELNPRPGEPVPPSGEPYYPPDQPPAEPYNYSAPPAPEPVR